MRTLCALRALPSVPIAETLQDFFRANGQVLKTLLLTYLHVFWDLNTYNRSCFWTEINEYLLLCVVFAQVARNWYPVNNKTCHIFYLKKYLVY